MPEKVALAWAEPGDVGGRFMDSVLRILYEDRDAVAQRLREDYSIVGHVYIESGPRIASARNALVRMFLAKEEWKEVEWLLMLDADMVFDASLLHHLFSGVRNDVGEVVRPLMGGLCFGGGHGTILPTMWRIVDPKTNHGSPVKIVADFEDNQLVEIDATGAACLLIHRSVLDKMNETFPEPNQWFAETVHNGQEFGEDWTFCMRARQLGFPIYVNTNAKIGHVKSIIMDETTWRTGYSGLKSIAQVVGTEQLKQMMEKPSKLIVPANREQRRAAERVRGR